MKTAARRSKPRRSRTASSPDARARGELASCHDACLTCELFCTMAMDVALTEDHDARDTRSYAVMRACATVCAATASSIERLREPDVESVADALVVCQAACRAARTVCARRALDEGAAGCAACGTCETLCETLLAHNVAMVA